MSTEAATLGAIIWYKLGAAFLVGILGAAIMAAFDPPKTKKSLFFHAAVAGIGSLIFGGPLIKILDHYFDFVNLATVTFPEYLEWAAPVYIIVGGLSWGTFGALAKFRNLVNAKAADILMEKIDGKHV